jgi:tRNA pseudouridine55 synthase
MAREIRTTKSGIVLVNKPVGISSNKVVNIVKGALAAKKCGHLGTLDLEGEGLLPVTVNSATRLFDYFLNKDKTYETTFIFGFETDTLDTSGQIIRRKECDISESDVRAACKTMLGKYMQQPPQYSAKKVHGQSAYKSARKGEFVELKPKEIEIFSFDLLEKTEKNTFRFSISCSSGTYIRSICRDLAEKLGTYGSMQCILRTRCGGFMLKDAFTLEQIEKGNFVMISPENVFDYPKKRLSDYDCERLFHGQKIECEGSDGLFRLYNGDIFLGVGKCDGGVLSLTLRLF